MLELNLLDKTEIRVENLKLEKVNLNEVARVSADVLGFRPEEVIVTDVRGSSLVLDVLRRTVYAEQVCGKRDELLKQLSKVPGVTVTEETLIHSEGILGLIAFDESSAREIVERSRELGEEVKRRVSKRAIVFPSGMEIRNGMVEDTNTPMIIRRLEEEGYKATEGLTLEDDDEKIAQQIYKALNMGYGLIVITGGIGAEDKDRTVEGVLKVDSEAETPYILKFKKGTGRHEKDGVKIAVGRSWGATILGLPGPNEEAKLALEVAIKGLREGLSKGLLANKIAQALRERVRVKMLR